MGNDGHITDVGRLVHQRADLLDREAAREYVSRVFPQVFFYRKLMESPCLHTAEPSLHVTSEACDLEHINRKYAYLTILAVLFVEAVLSMFFGSFSV